MDSGLPKKILYLTKIIFIKENDKPKWDIQKQSFPILSEGKPMN